MAAHVHISNAMIAQASASSMVNPWRTTPPSRFGWVGLLSVALHAGLGLAVMSVVVRAPEIAAPIRVTLYDPPPPPAMSAAVAAVPPPVQVISQHHEPAHLTKAARKPMPRISRRAGPAVAQPHHEDTPPSPVEMAAGQPGGVAGGVSGGVVGGNGRTLLAAEEASVQPIPIAKVMPEYPPVARVRGVEGQVVLEAILATDGHVEPDITVIQSVPLLDNAAVAALRQWRFRPARNRDGEPLRVTFRVPVRFQLR